VTARLRSLAPSFARMLLRCPSRILCDAEGSAIRLLLLPAATSDSTSISRAVRVLSPNVVQARPQPPDNALLTPAHRPNVSSKSLRTSPLSTYAWAPALIAAHCECITHRWSAQ